MTTQQYVSVLMACGHVSRVLCDDSVEDVADTCSEASQHQCSDCEDEEYRRKQAWKLAEIEGKYTRKLAEIDAYYAAEFARVEAAYGLGEIPEEELVALRYALTESARLDRERWGC